jgi:DHA1 family inner membrane transport protein
LGTWRTTLWFVAALGLASMIGVWALLRSIPAPARISLRDRLAPLHDVRIALTLLTTMFAFGGFLMVYTYAGLVFDRATGGDERVLAVLLLIWGVAATLGNIAVGRLVDAFGSRMIINGLLLVAIANFCLLPWSSASPGTSAVALCIWGVCGWGLIVPQQHRLVASAPNVASLLLALNNTATYAGLACSGLIGGMVILVVDHHYLSLVGVAWLSVALAFAEAAHAARRTEAVML